MFTSETLPLEKHGALVKASPCAVFWIVPAQTTDAMAINWTRLIAVLAADTLTGDKVVNRQKEDLGKIEHLMIDLETGRIAYAVLSFGGFLGMGDKLFAIPWSALALRRSTVEVQQFEQLGRLIAR